VLLRTHFKKPPNKVLPAVHGILQSLAAEKQHFAQALEASKEEWAEARVLDR